MFRKASILQRLDSAFNEVKEAFHFPAQELICPLKTHPFIWHVIGGEVGELLPKEFLVEVKFVGEEKAETF